MEFLEEGAEPQGNLKVKHNNSDERLERLGLFGLQQGFGSTFAVSSLMEEESTGI